jgi:hypothetical protein
MNLQRCSTKKKQKIKSAKRRWQRENNNKNPAEGADQKRTRRRDRVEIRKSWRNLKNRQ